MRRELFLDVSSESVEVVVKLVGGKPILLARNNLPFVYSTVIFDKDTPRRRTVWLQFGNELAKYVARNDPDDPRSQSAA